MSGWVGVITNAGQAALAQSIAEGEELNLNAVQVGTGYVNPANMRSATHLDTQTGTGTLRNMQQVDGGVSLIVNIPAQSSAANIKEVGVFGTIDGTSVLMALYQNEDGIDVPAASVFPDYSYRLSAMWSLDNTGTLTATVDPSALATVGDVEEAAEEVETDLNAAVTEINGHIEAMQGGLFIVSVGDTHAKINPKQFVYVLDHSTLSEGLYYNGTASAIQQNAALASAGLTNMSSSGGGLNLLSYYKMDCAMSRTLQGENLYGLDPGGYYYYSTCTNIPESGFGGFVQIFRRDATTKGAIAITDSGKLFINMTVAGMWDGWKELALDSKIGTVPSGKTVQGQIDSLNSNIATINSKLINWVEAKFTNATTFTVDVSSLGTSDTVPRMFIVEGGVYNSDVMDAIIGIYRYNGSSSPRNGAAVLVGSSSATATMDGSVLTVTRTSTVTLSYSRIRAFAI